MEKQRCLPAFRQTVFDRLRESSPARRDYPDPFVCWPFTHYYLCPLSLSSVRSISVPRSPTSNISHDVASLPFPSPSTSFEAVAPSPLLLLCLGSLRALRLNAWLDRMPKWKAYQTQTLRAVLSVNECFPSFINLSAALHPCSSYFKKNKPSLC